MPIFENIHTGKRYELLEGTLLPKCFRRVDPKEDAQNEPVTAKHDETTPAIESAPAEPQKKETTKKKTAKKGGAKNGKD